MAFAKDWLPTQPQFAAVEVPDEPPPQREDDAMFSSVQLRPIKIACDAPVYEVVKASGRIGLRSPEDVRWRRQRVPNGKTTKRKSLAGRLWRLLFAFGLPAVEEKCGCGDVLPERRFIRLRTLSGPEYRYSLTQCDRCRTIVWDEESTSGKRGVK